MHETPGAMKRLFIGHESSCVAIVLAHVCDAADDVHDMSSVLFGGFSNQVKGALGRGVDA